MPKAVLTIGIPTYNRATLLEECLKHLGPVILPLENEVELLISDNASTDCTQQVIESFTCEYQKSFRIKSIVQNSNVGAVPNIFELIMNTQTDYLLFIGDDDALDSNGLQRLIQSLKTSSPSHFIEGAWPWRDLQREVKVDACDLGVWGYEIGLAWASVYHVPSCKKALQSSNVRRELGSGIWGQIGLAMIGVSISRIDATVLPFSWGRVLLERPYSYGYENLLLSLRDLIRAHLEAAKFTGNIRLVLDFLTLKNHGFRSHVLGLLVQAASASEISPKTGLWADVSKDIRYLRQWKIQVLLWGIRTVCESPLKFFLRYLLGVARRLREIKRLLSK